MPRQDMPLPKTEKELQRLGNTMWMQDLDNFSRLTRVIALFALLVGCAALMLVIGIMKGYW